VLIRILHGNVWIDPWVTKTVLHGMSNADSTMEEKDTEGNVSAVSFFLEWCTFSAFSFPGFHHLSRRNPQPRSQNYRTVCNPYPCAQVDDI
jgi:hypothetical protein